MAGTEEFYDISLEIRSLAEGRFQTTLRTATQSEATEPFELPFGSVALGSVLSGLDLRALEAPRDLRTPPDEQLSQLTDREIGSELFRILFSGNVGRVFDMSRSMADEIGPNGTLRRLRLRLRWNLEDEQTLPLAALPWELLHDPLNRIFFGQGHLHLLVRHLAASVPIQPLQLNPPLKILAVSPSPSGLAPLDLERETQNLREALKDDDRLQLTVLPHASLDGTAESLKREQFNILHYMGHGSFDPGTGEGHLLFEDRQGRQDAISGELFSEMVKDLRHHLQLIVLNACRTAQMPRLRGQAPYTTVGAELSRAGFPAVVAMQFRVSDPAAIRFSQVFYTSLAEGNPVDVAVGVGRQALYRAVYRSRSLEWAAPVLFLRSADGHLFDLPVRTEKISVDQKNDSAREDAMIATPPSATGPLLLGIRSFEGWGHCPEHSLDLTELFHGRFIRHPVLWGSEVLPKLESFLKQAATGHQPLVLDFAAHASIAFAAGYVLEAKSGLDVTIRQRVQKGKGFEDWKPEDRPLPDSPYWKAEGDRVLIHGGILEGVDVAVAVSLTRPVLDDVQLYLEKSSLPIGRLLMATLAPAPSSTGVHGGAHALALAQALALRIRARTIKERLGTLHLFISAPNAFLFYLGQLARGLGQIRLYEYDFDSGVPGAYLPSIELPVFPSTSSPDS